MVIYLNEDTFNPLSLTAGAEGENGAGSQEMRSTGRASARTTLSDRSSGRNEGLVRGGKGPPPF